MRLRSFALLVTVPFICLSYTAHGSLCLPLKEAEERALENNEQIQRMKALVEASRQRRLQTISAWLPSASFSDTYTHYRESSPSGLDRYNVAEVSVSQPLISSDLYYNSAISSVEYKKSRYNLATVMNDLILQVRTGYYSVILSSEDIKVQEENIQLLASSLQQEKTNFELGRSTSFDVSQSKVAVVNALSSYYEAIKNNKVARNNFAQLLDISVHEKFCLEEETFPVFNIEELATKLESLGLSHNGTTKKDDHDFITDHVINADGTINEEIQKPLFSYNEILAWESKTLQQKPDILMKEAAEMSAYRLMQSKYGEYSPTVKAFGAYDATHSQSPSLRQNNNYWRAGITVSWNLFDGFARERKIKEASQLHKAAHLEYRDALDVAKVDVRNKIYTIEEALLSYFAAYEGVLLADEALEKAKSRRDVGDITPLEYRDVAASRTQAKQNFNKASFSLLTSYYTLHHSAGVDTSSFSES
jgi:outer membrane protein